MKKSSENNTVGVFLIGIILLLTTCSTYGADINSNMRQGMNFWRAMFENDLLQYYSVNVNSLNAGEMVHNANYGMFVIVINSLWMFPVYIAERIMGGNILDCFGARVWGKMFPLFLLTATLPCVNKIADLMGYDRTRKSYLNVLYLSSPLILLSVCHVAQLDIMGVFFCLFAVYHVMKGDKKGFYIFYTLAVLSKSLPFFVLLPVLLLYEKNLFKMLGIMVTPFLIDYCTDLPFKIVDPAGVHSKKADSGSCWIL